MARIRDYKAEERRRNALARSRGFTSRAAERGAKTRKDYIKAGYTSHNEYANARRAAKLRAERLSQKPASQYKPTYTAEQFRQYSAIFGNRKHGTKNRDEFLTDLAGVLHDNQPDEYPPWEGYEDWWRAY